MSRSEYERLMDHPHHNKTRSKVKWPPRLTPPRCDTCGKQLAPGVDHSTCKET